MQGIPLLQGFFIGSASWWFLLSGGVSLLRARVTVPSMRWVNRVAGFLLLLFGLSAVAAVAL